MSPAPGRRRAGDVVRVTLLARATLAATLLAHAALAAGCATSPPQTRTTFLRSVDLVEMTDELAQSFAASPAVQSRTPDSEPWTISLDRLTNRTNQIIREGEKWLYLVRLRGLLAQSDVGPARSITWVVPPERWEEVAREHDLGDEPGELRTRPTHRLTAEFLALTNTSAGGRTDAYTCSYQLVDLETGRIVWEDVWEVKRAAFGRTWD